MAVPKNTQTRFVGIANVSHPLYIPTLAFQVAVHIHIMYGAHAGMENQY